MIVSPFLIRARLGRRGPSPRHVPRLALRGIVQPRLDRVAGSRAAWRGRSHKGASAMTYNCLLYEVKDGVATLTLNRPDRLNALGDTLREDLFDAVSRGSADPEVRVMIVTGAGKGFCAGGDVKAMNEAKESGRERSLMDKIAPGRDRTLLAMREAPQPII